MSQSPPRVALITGASRGIGRAIAVQLAQSGYLPALVGRNQEALDETAKLCRDAGARPESFPADLNEPAALAGLVDAVVGRCGRLDVLVNAAGVLNHAPVQDADLAAWDHLYRINVNAVYHLTHHALPHLRKHQEGAAVIQIASAASRHTHAEGAAYCGSKHAVLGFSHCLFEDVRAYGIKVAAICPGYVDTAMIAGRGVDASRAIRPEDVAAAVDFVLRSGKNCCPTEIALQPQYPVR